MEELFNLKYKDEIEKLKDEENFEELGDKKYLEHEDMEARLYWAFCRPSGSCLKQLQDPHPIVSIMAFNHSRLPALKRFQSIHKDVINQDNLRIKIAKRTRMLFRDLIDQDFKELNEVLDIIPVFLDVAIDQLKNGRKWNDIVANELEATIFIKRAKVYLDEEFFDALYLKLQSFEEFDANELKVFLEQIETNKNNIDKTILEYYNKEALSWIEQSNLHILQKKGLEKSSSKLIDI
ncbi:MAG: hypothetical protein U9R16_09860 [Campylobacterota bacterium]|nr:hypothetical protein [Campylobacterota bacterium]